MKSEKWGQKIYTDDVPWQYVTTQIWIVHLIGWKFALTNQQHLQDQVTDTKIKDLFLIQH